MKKTLFSVVPLFVLLAPVFPVLPRLDFLPLALLAGLSVPAASSAEAVSPRQVVLRQTEARLKRARQVLQEQPRPESTDFVTLAVDDASSPRVQLLELPKSLFLTKDAEAVVQSSAGQSLRLRVVRPNYVNTAVRVTDAEGREFYPLMVRYPVEKGGELSEVAYYTSAHPAMSAPVMAGAGQQYVRRMLDEAAARLAARGQRISPDVVDVAERLCVVEHTDHKRFMGEDRASLYREIYTLYALNGGDTYRYSVSSAGAGGMVQMIPPTYHAVRARHGRAGLQEDFVTGMRDHANALEAMLLYMQDTWNHLLSQEEVRAALASGVATQPELLAAGYNSNPYRLATYLRRGGSNWRFLIPAETQMYLQIYASAEDHIDFEKRS